MIAVESKAAHNHHSEFDAGRAVNKPSARRKFAVVSTPIGDRVNEQDRPMLARLCGGTTSCLVNIEV